MIPSEVFALACALDAADNGNLGRPVPSHPSDDAVARAFRLQEALAKVHYEVRFKKDGE